MSSSLTVTPLSTLLVSKHLITAHNKFPNSSILQKPLLIYHAAFTGAVSASAVEVHLTATAGVHPQWRYTMYSTSHFHSTTHEVLAVVQGRAKLCFGGEENPSRVEPTVQAGDVMVVPAGMAHRLLEDLDGSFEMVGSYPLGCEWDMCYGREGENSKVEKIGRLGWFERDPIYGKKGPVLEV